MHKHRIHSAQKTIPFLAYLSIGLLLGACSSSTTSNPANVTHFTQTNLVSDTAGFGAQQIDPNLVNAWGLAMGSSGHPWISANGTGLAVFYDTNGMNAKSIGIPMPNGMPGGAVSGIAGKFGSYNFVFSTEDGTILGWTAGATNATILSDSSASGAVFKGIAIDPIANKLYATDFHNNAIVVYNTSFKVMASFTDNSIPAGYGPFGIAIINDTLYVTYALQKVGAHDDSAVAGTGFVDRFSLSGTSATLIGRLASGSPLNSPWSVVQAPASFGTYANAILVGNFGDGKITAYSTSGSEIGQLSTSSATISIDGLWGLGFNGEAGSDPNKLFFTAGPDGESHGLFGYLTIAP